ncbi:MAG TPA: TIR domain-containing protein [Bacteroidales bacterium]|nr:TIR domain-containing protein [Bacteroidales bacterium]
MHDVFISYSRSDSVEVNSLCHAIEEAGISYWLDTADIPLGTSFPAEISRAIDSSKLLVFVSSVHSNKSPYVTSEVRYALESGKMIIPFKIDSENYSDDLKLFLVTTNYFAAYPPPVSKYMTEFVDRLKLLIDSTDNNRPVLKRIIDENDPDVPALLEIYHNCFENDRCVADEFILSNLFADNNTNHKAYLFVLKKMNRNIGMADVSYFCDSKLLFVSYIAVHHFRYPGEKLIYTHNIIEGIQNYFQQQHLEIDALLFETEEERIYKFFNRVFNNRFHKKIYKICIDYTQPTLVSDSDPGVAGGNKIHLVYMPCQDSGERTSIKKETVITLIKQVYFEIYLHIRDNTYEERYKYLDELIREYCNHLPEDILLEWE